MRKTGFEPAQALSYESLNLARLTTPALPLKIIIKSLYKKLYKSLKSCSFEDGHSRLETPGLFPNPEVKLPTPFVLVPDKARSSGAVFHFIFLKRE